MTPVRHMPIINAVFEQTAQTNGMTVSCITLPLDCKQQRTLTPCANLPNPPNHVTLNCSHVVLICRHTTIETLIPLTMQTTTIALQSIAAPIAALAVAHAVVTSIMMMITAANALLALILVTNLLGIMIFSPQTSPTRWNQILRISNNINTLLTVLPILTMQRCNLPDNPTDFSYKEPVSLQSGYSDTSIPSGDANPNAWDTNPVKNPYHPVHFDGCGNCEAPITATFIPIMMTMTMTVICILAKNPLSQTINSAWVPSTPAILLTPKPKNTVIGIMPNQMNNPHLGWLIYRLPFTIVRKLTSLTIKKKAKMGHHHQFLHGMCQTYRDLTSSNLTDVYDINKDQKHILNKIIQFVLGGRTHLVT